MPVQIIRLLLNVLLFNCLIIAPSYAQDLPHMMHRSTDGHRLISGKLASSGFYAKDHIAKVELWFEDTDWWQQLLANYQSGENIAAQLIVDGDTLASAVGVRFKGTTSFFLNNTDKKSFNIALDYEDPNQDIDGYETLNLNCAFLDPSFIREVLYLELCRAHMPAAQGNFTELYLNGTYWGLYPSIQQLNGDFIKEWWPSADGTRWRAIKSSQVWGGNPFGTGESSLNYLGNDVEEYQDAYTLKTSNKPNPWEDLIVVTDVLENTPLSELEDAIREVMDLDRTLWFLAYEILFSDDDGYVYKGGMDYYLYWDPETSRMTPLEYDGNTVMELDHANWSVFYNFFDDRYPLLHRLLAVPSIRQRYLAHVRTLLEFVFTEDKTDQLIDGYTGQLDSLVQNDPKKIYNYAGFINSLHDLKLFVENRRAHYFDDSEVNQPYLSINDVKWSVNGESWATPKVGEALVVNASISNNLPVHEVNVFYGTGIMGHFEKMSLFDDGMHEDGQPNDGIYGGILPEFQNGAYIRFYIEAIAGDAAHTRTYHPRGAEHDVYFLRMSTDETAFADVTINEFQAANDSTVSDPAGEYDDWIELYNKAAQPTDLTGFYLSDNEEDLKKWPFPDGTTIEGNGYLIIWADEDGGQDGLHTNFKLNADGELLLLVDSLSRIVENIPFGMQVSDRSYARIPNGTGNFVEADPTFGENNELSISTDEVLTQQEVIVYPNPVRDQLIIQSDATTFQQLQISNVLGQIVFETTFWQEERISVSHWPSGIYSLQLGQYSQLLIID